MPTNSYMFLVAALIPLVIGAIYYHEKVLGGAWMKTNGFSMEDLAGGNMAMIFGLSYLYSVLIALTMSGIVIHQGAVFQMMIPDSLEAGSAAQQQFNDLMAQYGHYHRNFGHGVIHGIILTVMFVAPLIAINALFERRGWKYILIHSGYWLISLSLMGGLLCQTLQYAPVQ